MKESFCFQGDKCILFLNGKRGNLWSGCWDSALFRGTWKKNAICPLQLKDKIDIFMKRYFIFKAGVDQTNQWAQRHSKERDN